MAHFCPDCEKVCFCEYGETSKDDCTHFSEYPEECVPDADETPTDEYIPGNQIPRNAELGGEGGHA